MQVRPFEHPDTAAQDPARPRLAAEPVPGLVAGAGLLAEITADVAAGADMPDVLRRFLAPLVRLAGAEAGAVRALTDDELQLRLIGQIGMPEHLACAEELVDSQCGICGQAAVRHQAAWADDLQGCRGRSPGHSEYFGSACQRVLAVPLQRRGRVLGVYNLFFGAGKQPPDDLVPLLRSVGELLGLALDNARLEREMLTATILTERQAMAAEVHDAVAQSLAFIKMRTPLLRQAIESCDQAQSMKYLHDVGRAVTEAHASLREVLTHFRAPMHPQGLWPALADCAVHFQERAGLALQYVNEVPELRLSAAAEAEIFHIVQEALANIAKHASARQAWLTITAAGRDLGVLVEDDGVGLAPGGKAPAREGHHGMNIMRERAQRIGGTISVGARQGGGTRVQLSFPAPWMAARPLQSAAR